MLISDSKEDLQNSLDILHDYCNRWSLMVNVAKTKIVVFSQGGRSSIENFWFYGDILIEVVTKFNFLGLELGSNGKFSCTQNDLANRGLRAMYALQRRIGELVYPDIRMQLGLFDSLVKPVLLYGCEIWGFHQARAVEKVHLKFLKWMLKAKRSTCNEMIYGELSRSPLLVERHFRIIVYWLKIVMNRCSCLVKNTYNLMVTADQENNVMNWASLIRMLLFNLGFAEAWYEQNVGDINVFKIVCRQRLSD